MTTTRYLIIDKKDDVYLKIEADEDIRRELGQFFTFEVPGFKFMPQFRNRVWDGKIRLFSYQTGQIYVGLYPYILNGVKTIIFRSLTVLKYKIQRLMIARLTHLLKH